MTKEKINKKQRKITENRFKERFSDYFKGNEEYLDYVRERWTNEDVVIIFEYGLRLGKLRGKKLK